jgi:hypothetical protein
MSRHQVHSYQINPDTYLVDKALAVEGNAAADLPLTYAQLYVEDGAYGGETKFLDAAISPEQYWAIAWVTGGGPDGLRNLGAVSATGVFLVLT